MFDQVLETERNLKGQIRHRYSWGWGFWHYPSYTDCGNC